MGIGLAVVLGAGPAVAATGPFAVLQSLQGTWAIRSGSQPIATVMTYDTGSKGSIVTEEFGRELSVFTQDRGSVLMTHYCNAGNQPRLRLKPLAAPGILDFVMTDITGLDDPNAPHVQEVIYRLRDARTMDLTIVWTGVGASAPEAYTLSRQ